jgi:hypothetical protein
MGLFGSSPAARNQAAPYPLESLFEQRFDTATPGCEPRRFEYEQNGPDET